MQDNELRKSIVGKVKNLRPIPDGEFKIIQLDDNSALSV